MAIIDPELVKKLNFGFADEAREEWRHYETNRIMRAKPIKHEDWAGPVMREYYPSEFSNAYHATMADFIAEIELNDREGRHSQAAPRPSYCWPCLEEPVVHASIDDIIGAIEFPDGQDVNDLEGFAELKAAIEKFNTINAGLIQWIPDFERVILL